MFDLSKENFETEVLESEKVVFVDYYAQTCEPCKALMPHIEELETQYGESIKFCKLDTGKARRLAIKQKVLGLPTLVMYKNGEKVAELTKDDAVPQKIEEMIKNCL